MENSARASGPVKQRPPKPWIQRHKCQLFGHLQLKCQGLPPLSLLYGETLLQCLQGDQRQRKSCCLRQLPRTTLRFLPSYPARPRPREHFKRPVHHPPPTSPTPKQHEDGLAAATASKSLPTRSSTHYPC